LLDVHLFPSPIRSHETEQDQLSRDAGRYQSQDEGKGRRAEKSGEIKTAAERDWRWSVQRAGRGVVRELAYGFGDCGAKPMNRIDAYRMVRRGTVEAVLQGRRPADGAI
jgi:hypothetical protein